MMSPELVDKLGSGQAMRMAETLIDRKTPAPYVVMNEVDVSRSHGMAPDANLHAGTYEVLFWGKRPEEARSVFEAACDVWNGFRGEVDLGSNGAITTFQSVRLIDGGAMVYDEDRELYAVDAFFTAASKREPEWVQNPWRPDRRGAFWWSAYTGDTGNPYGLEPSFWASPSDALRSVEAAAASAGASRCVAAFMQGAAAAGGFAASMWYALPTKVRAAIVRHVWTNRTWEWCSGAIGVKNGEQRSLEIRSDGAFAAWGFVHRATVPLQHRGFRGGWVFGGITTDRNAERVLQYVDNASRYARPVGCESFPIVDRGVGVVPRYVLDAEAVTRRPYIADWLLDVLPYGEDADVWSVNAGTTEMHVLVGDGFEGAGGTTAVLDDLVSRGFIITIDSRASVGVRAWWTARYGGL